MRFFLFLFCIMTVTYCTKQEVQHQQVNFRELPFSEILEQAQYTQSKILVDFWADG